MGSERLRIFQVASAGSYLGGITPIRVSTIFENRSPAFQSLMQSWTVSSCAWITRAECLQGIAISQGPTALLRFDLLWLNGEYLRKLSLVKRKKRLKKLVKTSKNRSLLFADHISGRGADLYQMVCGGNLQSGRNRGETQEQQILRVGQVDQDQESDLYAE